MTSPFLPLDRTVIAREAAKMFLEIGAVLFYKDEPFKFTSGWASPVYTDSRKIISFPRLRSTLMDFATATIVREIVDGARTLLVEDLATDGRSKVNFCKALRESGAQVDHCFVLFYYDIFPGSAALMEEIGIKLHYLTTWWDVLAVAKEMGTFDPKTLDEVERFLNAPAEWSAAHGGISAFGQA